MQEFVIGKLRELTGLEIFEYRILGSTTGEYAVALASFFVFLIVLKFIQWAILVRMKKLAGKTKTDIDDTLVRIVKTIKPPFYLFLSFYLAVRFFLELPAAASRFINVILIVWVVYQVIGAVQVLINYVVRKAMRGEGDDAKVAAGIVGKIAKVTLWIIGLLLILSNFGVNINSLIAGLGIGGIAIAFALQNILSDVFSSFAIYFDKPFVVGDFIVVGPDKGVVERIGIKTTRIRSLGGEELVISNKEITSARVQNFKQMNERRISFTFGVLYETDNRLLRKIPGIVKDIIENIESTRFDRAHFQSFGDSSLDFEAVYYIESQDYNLYMDIQQEINLGIREEFEKEGIEMAYPTRTVYIAGGGKE